MASREEAQSVARKLKKLNEMTNPQSEAIEREMVAGQYLYSEKIF
jgi:hypothetical protein